MRSRDPRILVYVKRSLLETILISILFIDVFVLYAILLGSLARKRLTLYSWEHGYQKYCQKSDPHEWGDYCKRVAKRRVKNTYYLWYNHIFVFAIVVIVSSSVCAELIFELQVRCREFCRWYRNSYRLNIRRNSSRGG